MCVVRGEEGEKSLQRFGGQRRVMEATGYDVC